MLSRTRTAVYLIFLVLVWGINWPLSKHALLYSPPLLFAGLRLLIGGILLLLIAIPRYRKLRFKETWPLYFISALFNIILYYGLQTIGLGYLPAGLFSAIVFLQPVLLGICAWLWLGERMYGLKIIGLILGFLGVGVIGGGGLTGSLSPVGVMLALGSAVSWTLGTVYMKKITGKVDSIWIATLQILIGGIVLLVLGSCTESWSAIQWNGSFMLDTLFIAIFVIAVGWLIFFKLVGSGEASTVGSYTFLIPVISIICSVIFMGESLTINLIIGFVMIVGSIILVNATGRIRSRSLG
ncbi:DMT family transporter [Paenibacillus zeisoli]|uniref:DMT family transporter n=1 Tax=Paenibacillus zeisoli TaxID=2496267 RepID=A0A433XMY4_9BACL|nr:DMT family transporter [Paenibacillus zeisoli]RUT35486.1 DMT family transporter [Paenibacillus zeisoli]